MIKRCTECKTRKSYPSNYIICPLCGGALETLSDYIMRMYNDETPIDKIAKNIHMNKLSVCNVVNRKLEKENRVPNYVQTPYIEQIRTILAEGWFDGKLKPVKEKLPTECTYETIAYVVDLVKKENKTSIEEIIKRVDNAISESKTLEEIAEKTNANSYIIEREIVKLIHETGAENSPYIQKEYVDDILRMASAEWDGKIRTLKANLPEDCTYLTIKAVLALNGL